MEIPEVALESMSPELCHSVREENRQQLREILAVGAGGEEKEKRRRSKAGEGPSCQMDSALPAEQVPSWPTFN